MTEGTESERTKQKGGEKRMKKMEVRLIQKRMKQKRREKQMKKIEVRLLSMCLRNTAKNVSISLAIANKKISSSK